MTKAEVETLIQEELRRAMGSHAGLLNLRESDSQRVAREAAEDRREKQLRRERKAERRELKESTQVFRDLGMPKQGAKHAAEGRAAGNGAMFRGL
jgi:hypothetical protein